MQVIPNKIFTPKIMQGSITIAEICTVSLYNNFIQTEIANEYFINRKPETMRHENCENISSRSTLALNFEKFKLS